MKGTMRKRRSIAGLRAFNFGAWLPTNCSLH